MSAVNTISDYLERVKILRKQWGCKPGQELWFRGEDRDFKTTILFPKVYRPNHPTDFLLQTEDTLLEDFQRCGSHLDSEIVALDRFEWYMQMQHHGAPTRLLDWSDGALIALHFAVKRTTDDLHVRFVYAVDPAWLNDESHPEPAAEHDPDEDEPILELYLPSDVGKLGAIPEKPLVLEFHQTTRRMGAQRSHFVLCGRDRHWLPSKVDQHGSRLAAIAIDDAPSLREELRSCGITESVIFPDLDGLGRDLTDLWNTRLAV